MLRVAFSRKTGKNKRSVLHASRAAKEQAMFSGSFFCPFACGMRITKNKFKVQEEKAHELRREAYGGGFSARSGSVRAQNIWNRPACGHESEAHSPCR
jgi:hypothetical protein